MQITEAEKEQVQPEISVNAPDSSSPVCVYWCAYRHMQCQLVSCYVTDLPAPKVWKWGMGIMLVGVANLHYYWLLQLTKMVGGLFLVGAALYAYKRRQEEEGGDKETEVVDATDGFDADPEAPAHPPTPTPPYVTSR